VAAPSEQISQKWIEGADRKCSRCGRPITNLAKQVGVVRTVYPSRRREILCMDCRPGIRDRPELQTFPPYP
jgi:hypothetical protein